MKPFSFLGAAVPAVGGDATVDIRDRSSVTLHLWYNSSESEMMLLELLQRKMKTVTLAAGRNDPLTSLGHATERR
jgi:hypothetical protein